MSVGLLLALAAAPPGPGPVRLIQCRMMECDWSRRVSNRIVRTTPRGRLRQYVAWQGRSIHRDSLYPVRYAGSLPIRWGKRPATDYVFCARAQPALAFRADGRWIAHALDLFHLAGYQEPSATTYLLACHGRYGLAPGPERGRALRRLGYRPGTRSEQVSIDRPEALVALPARPND
ncbi:MAG: hypothetical protein JO013_10500 [Alphaproteobacteria bacterium]|nr:hypothetical protein [Alphaproteobacteria bacterium]